MRLLLTSAGISNTSIHDALLDLQAKPIAEASTLFVSTAIYAMSVRDLLTCFRPKSSRECGRRCTRVFFAGVRHSRLPLQSVQSTRVIWYRALPIEGHRCIASDYDERFWVRHGSSGPERIRRRSRIQFEASIIRFHFLEAAGHSAL
jgi:hypothetical protein